MQPTTPKQVVKYLDDARILTCYQDNTPASVMAEWLLFNARSMVEAEAAGDANYLLHLARLRRDIIFNA